MKKYTFINGRKLIIYLFLYLIVSVISTVLMIVFKNTSLYVGYLLFLFWIAFIVTIIDKYIKVYKIDSEKIIKGFPYKKVVYFKEITKIELEYSTILIHSDEKKGPISIEVFDSNIDDVKRIINEIKKNIDITNIYFDKKVDDFIEFSKIEKNENEIHKIRGGLLLIVVWLAVALFNNILLIASDVILLVNAGSLITIARIIIITFFIIAEIVLLLNLSKRKKKAGAFLKVYVWALIGYNLFIRITSFLIDNNEANTYLLYQAYYN